MKFYFMNRILFQCNNLDNFFFLLAKSYPRGFAGGMREYSDLVHKISCWDDHPDDYKTILLDFICFLRVKHIILIILHSFIHTLSIMY